MSYKIPNDLLLFLGACIYNDPVEYYNSLSPAEQVLLDQQGKNYGMTAWFYRYLRGFLPAPQEKKYQTDYQKCAAISIRTHLELKRFYHIFSNQQIRFVTIKGADLAYRLYPDPALRKFGDFDVWFHPDDCERALIALEVDGWDAPIRYAEKKHPKKKETEHHFYPHRRNGFIIEPHYTLANFEGISPRVLWNYTTDYPSGNGQRILSPEMNLLMLMRHAASKSSFHAQLPKLLTDAALVVQKETIDFSKLHEMTAKWRLPYPGNLLAAFPEFFPKKQIESFEADPAETNKFRRLFEKRGQLDAQNNATITFSKLKTNRNILEGLLRIICSVDVSMIRYIYHLPREGAWMQVIWAFIRYFISRSRRLLKAASRVNLALQEYNTIVKEVEKTY